MLNLTNKELFEKARPLYEDYVRAANDLDDYATAAFELFMPYGSEIDRRGLAGDFLEFFAKGERR